jgi:hypothetical protein
MKHQQEILEKKFKTNKSSYELVIRIFENIAKSNKNYIPKIRNKADHESVLKVPGITYYKKDNSFQKLSARYQIDWSLELGYAAFIFLEKYFKLTFPKKIEDYEEYLINLREVHQTKTKCHGNINLVFAYAIRSSMIVANYRFGSKFNKILIGLIKDKLSEYEFEILHDLKYCIPNIKLTNKEIHLILQYLKSQKRLDLSTLNSFELYLQNNQSQLQSALNYFSNKDYPDILAYIYTIRYSKSDKSLFTERKHRKARLFTISRIKFNHLEDVDKAITIALGNVKSNKIMCLRILKNVLESEMSSNEHSEICYQNLKDILLSSEEDKSEVFDWILRMNNERIPMLLLDLIEENIQIILNNIHRVAEYLWMNSRKNIKVSEVFYSIIQKQSAINLNVFKRYVNSLDRKNKKHLCTWLLNNNDNSICSKVKNLSFMSFGSRLELDDEYLKTLRIYDLKYIANKVIAFVYTAENLTGLIFDLLKSELPDKKLDNLVIDIFINHLLFNYHYPNDFLADLKKTGSSREKRVAKAILNENKKRWENYDNPDMIEELKISGYWLREYNKMRFQNIPDSKNQEDFSLTQLFQNIEIKAGKLFTVRNNAGEYSPSSRMSQISSSFEIPKGEFLDPISQQQIRMKAFKYKREK